MSCRYWPGVRLLCAEPSNEPVNAARFLWACCALWVQARSETFLGAVGHGGHWLANTVLAHHHAPPVVFYDDLLPGLEQRLDVGLAEALALADDPVQDAHDCDGHRVSR